MMKRTKRIQDMMEKNFNEFNISVSDDSFAHKGHNNFDGNDETHIKIELKNKCNLNINRLEIHKKINTLLFEEFKKGLHALQIKIK